MEPGRVTNSFILLLALGVFASGSTSSSSKSSQSGTDSNGPASSQEVQASPAPTGFDTVLEKYLGPNSKPNDLCVSRIDGQMNIVHALIATLPDPSDPHLADVFDNYLGSIQLALAKDGYLADQYWLPEVIRRREQAKNKLPLSQLPQPLLLTPVDQGDPTSRGKPKADVLDQPGVLLYRRQPIPGMPDELLFLLLVPETPTGGVRQEALRAALDRAASIRCPPGPVPPDATIRIIGPSFSGTAASLARGIKRWQDDVHVASSHVEILSGSATNIHTQELFKDIAKFKATVTPDDVMCDFYKYLTEKFAKTFASDKQVIAIFTESNTSYGQSAPNSLKNRGLPYPCHDESAKPETVAASEPANPNTSGGSEPAKPDGNDPKADKPDDKKKEQQKPRILDLYFPLHVSQIGAEYEKSRTQKAVAALPEGDARLLSLNLLEQDEPGDVPPAMSALTKYNADLSLVNNLMAIDRAHLNLVGIRATDARDEIFLARKIKQIVPDVQLFLLDSALLFSHTSLAKEMRGALVVSRYPLFNLNQLWTPPWQLSPRVQFVSGSSQGVYNAAILQLREFHLQRKRASGSAKLESTDGKPTPVNTTQRAMIPEPQKPEGAKSDRPDPDDLLKPLEYGAPFQVHSDRPLLWVGMVGHYGIWPIGTLGGEEPKNPKEDELGLKLGSLNQYVGESDVNWKKVKDYTAEFPWDDAPLSSVFGLVYPYGVLHSFATLLLLVLILWHVIHAFGRWATAVPTTAKTIDDHPLVCSAPASIPKDSPSALGYAAVQLLGWQSLIAIYLIAVAPIVAIRKAAVDLKAKPSEFGFELVLNAGYVSAAMCFLLGLVLSVRVFWILIMRRKAARRKIELITHIICGLIGTALLLLASLYFREVVFKSVPATQVFLWVRTANWLSGISPMLPLLFLGGAMYATTWLNLYRLAIATNTDERLPRFTTPLKVLVPESQSLEDAEQAADKVALGQSFVGWPWLVLLAIPAVVMVVLFNIRPSAESTWWTWSVRGLLGMVILGMLHGLVLLVQLWRKTSKTLDQLGGHPILDVLKCMQHELAAMVGLHPYAAAPRRDQVLACERAQYDALKRWADDQPRPSTQEATEIQGIQTLQAGITWASKKLKEKAWPSGKKQPAWSRIAAKLVALEVVRALSRRIAIIRALIGILTIDAFVLLMVTEIYPFQPHSMLSGLSWFLLISVVIASAWALVAMERDAVLSYASGSEPGKVTWDASFVLHLALFVVLPLAALVAAHFPEIGGPIFESLQPLVRSAR